MKETENELQDFSEKSESNDISSSNTGNNFLPIQKKGGGLRSIHSLLGQEEEEIEEADNQKLQSIDAILRDDSEVFNYTLSTEDYGSNDMVLAKYLYIMKDFVYMFALLLSSGFNFGWLYFPFLFLSFISYFLLFKSTKFSKKLKKIIEIISLLYGLALIGIKIYIVVQYPKDLLEILENLGMPLIEEESKNKNFMLFKIFFGESLVIIISIISLIISYICTDFNTSEQIQKNRNMKEEDFYWLMAKCIYFTYFMIVGFAIFNRSILTLCYILPMNILLYFLSMNSNQKLIFCIYKILSIIMIFVITAQIVLINVFNVKYISQSFDYQNVIIGNHNCTYNFYTQLGINQADNCIKLNNNSSSNNTNNNDTIDNNTIDFDIKELFFTDNNTNDNNTIDDDTNDVDIENILIQYFAYFFAIGSLLSLIFSYKKLSNERLNKAIQNSLNQENEVELEESSKNGFMKVIEIIKDYLFSPNFILHICRISAILWLFSYQNFYSIGIIIWLLFSFLFIHIKSNKFFTIVFLSPMIIICLFCYHFSNIDGFIDDTDENSFKSRFGIAKFKNKYIEYILCNIFYFLTTLFIYALFIREERKEQEKLREKIKEEHSKEIENELYNNNKNNNINNENIQNIENKENTDTNINYNFNISNQDGIAIGLLPNENNNINDLENVKFELNDKEIDELYNNLTLFNIILKTLFSNIDKITLVFLYIFTVDSINIIHGIFVLIFMIQLLFPIFMIKNSIIMLILSQIIFLFEYLVDLFKNIEFFNKKSKIIKLIIPFDSDSRNISCEFLIYIIAYCYYTQYQLYNYDFYQQLAYDENICLSIYIEIKLSDYPIIRKILFGIGKIILELYIWTLIASFIIVVSYKEISILFAFKLFIFFIIVYKFLRVIQSNKPNHLSLLLNWLFLIFCSLNTIAVYAFQVLCLDFFSFGKMIPKSNNFYLINFPAIGYYRYYEKDLHYKFLPHFISNLLSVLFIGEMKRILNEDKINNKKKKGEINSDQIDNTKNRLLQKKKTIMAKENIKKEEKEKEKDEEKNKNNNNIRTDSEIIDENNLNIDEIKEVDEAAEENDNDSGKVEEGEKKEEEEPQLSPSEEYEINKRKMNILEAKYYFYNFLLIFTKFYWLFLFLSICIIFTAYDLSIVLTIYILIFGITFIRMFRHIITRLTNFIKEKSFFISRLIRYNLIEQKRHVKENTKYRALAFKYLLIFSLFCYYLYYLDGIFYLFQHFCQNEDEGECETEDKPKPYKLVGKGGIYNYIDEDLIISISYIFGFDVNLKSESVLFAGWIHIFFGALICFDVYVQKIEIYYNELCKRNRKKYRKLANINVQLRPLAIGEENIIMNITSTIEKLKNQKSEEFDNKSFNSEVTNINANVNSLKSAKTIKFVIDAQNDEEERRIGQKLIENFLSIFAKATETDVKLSNSNKKYKMIQIFKKIFEEIIIFLLICTAISKLNIWSFVYMTLALYFIVTEKSMMKYYFLYCFIIATILLQSIIIISNLNINTDPKVNEDYIKKMNDYFSIPWYKKRLNLSDERAYFLGLGVARSQIFLFWMDFIEVVIIYIYLDYFSYSIYQETNTIGRMKSKDNKINYYNLYLDSQVKEVSEKMTEFEYKKHEDCMKYNFDLQILPFPEFKYYMTYGKSIDKFKREDKEVEEINEINNERTDENKINLGALENDKENNEINTDANNINESGNNINNETGILRFLPTYDNRNRNRSQSRQLLLKDALQKAQTMKISKSTILLNIKDKENSNNKFYNMLKEFTYLSAHNIILLLIIIISMMVSGLISVFYITFSLYFLITSTSIYLGNKYYYPRAIKRILRIGILIDISLQILYQSPLDSKEVSEENKETTFYTILEIIGLNKILSFKNKDEFEVIVDGDQMILVLSKAFIYLFMSFQILVYSSESFQEYYLSYIITKNNNLRRISLMNVFKFNNKRVEVMNKSIKLRLDMSKDMDRLQKTLEKWNTNIMKINGNKSALALPQMSQVSAPQNQEIDNSTNNEKKALEEKKEEQNPLLRTSSSLLSNLLKLKSEADLNVKREESQHDNLNIEQIKNENEDIKKHISTKTSITLSNLFLNNPFEEDKKYVPKEEVIKSIKNWILGGFLIRFQIGLHKLAANYNTVKKGEKDDYERDIIQGKLQTTTFIEKLVDKKLNNLDLEHFTLAEMKEVQSFFDGTREKKLAELKKKKEIKKKLQKDFKKAFAVGKMNELLDVSSQKKENVEPEENSKKKVKFSLKMLKGIKKNKTEGILSSFRKQQEKDKENVINLNSSKFKNLDKFMTDKLFVKYLKTGYIIRSIIKDCFSFFSNNFHWVCYCVMILNHIMSSSILTLFYPLSIFCYAIMEYPRPKRGYWSFCFIYTVILSTIKFIIQQKFLTTNENYTDFISKLDKLKFGLKVCKSTFSKDFFIYIVFDSLVLIILLINDYLLVSKGLFKKREQQIETIYQAMERIALTKDLVIKEPDKIKEFNDSYLIGDRKKLVKKIQKIEDDYNEENQIDVTHIFSKFIINDSDSSEQKEDEKKVESVKMEQNKERKKSRAKRKSRREEEKSNKDKKPKKDKEKEEKKEKERYDESKRTYFQTLFPKVRNEKPGNEYYVSYTLTMVFIIIYLLLFYTTMVQDKTYGAVTVQTKQFSGTMVIFLLIHVGFLVYDRILFISQNRNNLEYEYRLYNKITNENKPISDFDFIQIKNRKTSTKKEHFIISPEHIDELKKEYNVLFIQTEEFNTPLFQKYLLQILLVVFAHIFVFFFLPMIGNYSLNGKYYCDKKDLNGECNDFLDNKLILIFYFFYVIYFIGSGLQIKYGFYDMKRKSVLKSKNNSIGGGIYNGYKNVPFLYEIKLGIDWTFTSTCLDLFQWNKFESVYDILYTTNCSMNGINSKLVGQQVGKFLKVGMGGFLSFGLIFVLVGPLMLFSSLNPTNKLNNLTNADLKLELSFTYNNKLHKNYTIFQNSKPESIESISDDDMERFNYTKSVDTRNFPREQIQTVKFFEENDRNWDLARPHINNLIELIHDRDFNEINKIDLVIDYSFYRLLPAEAQRANKRYEKNIFSKETDDEAHNISLSSLDHALSSCYDVNITYDEIYSPPIRLKASSHPKRVKDKKNFFDCTVQIGFVGCKNKTDSFGDVHKSYLESYFTFRFVNSTTHETEGIRFHVFSDKVSSTTLNYSALTFYVSFVLLVGNYVRNFFSGQPTKISLTEMPHNEELLNLCEGIKVSRYSYNFEEEEKLYYILIEIMRSPEYLRMLTSSSIDQFNQRLIMTKACKTTDDVS